jgi:aryl-alcohol dehydrogenase-like predicted oxidoreductase
MPPILCLGTAQYGMRYGITNLDGVVEETEVSKILSQANSFGISWLDTAQAYGNAEKVIGRNLPKDHTFRLISKLPAQDQEVYTTDNIEKWESSLVKSCRRMGVTSLEALLIHSPKDLKKPDNAILSQWLLSIKERGLVGRLGISIYSPKDLEGISPEFQEIVQLPLSLYDQRLLNDGTIRRLIRQGTKIHARSIFLQGLLLLPSCKWPIWMSRETREHHAKLEQLAVSRGCSLQDCVLGFVKAQEYLEAVVVGICSLKELQQLLHSWEKCLVLKNSEWKNWALYDTSGLDPRSWPC